MLVVEAQSYPFQLDLNEKPTSSAYGLQEAYTEIKPTPECLPEAPVTSDYSSKIDSSRQEVEDFASRWIEKIAEEDSFVGDEPISFSSYYSHSSKPLHQCQIISYFLC